MVQQADGLRKDLLTDLRAPVYFVDVEIDEYESHKEDDDEEDEKLIDGVKSKKFHSMTKTYGRGC